jgi:hypothetical protein
MPIDFSDYLERSIDTSPSSAGFSIQGGRAVRTLVVKMTPTTEDLSDLCFALIGAYREHCESPLRSLSLDRRVLERPASLGE